MPSTATPPDRGGRMSRLDVPAPLPRRSRWLVSFMRRYAASYLARHFSALRLSKQGPAPPVPPGPLIVILNHPSWWDPITALLLADRFPDRAVYAPMEAKELARYPLLGRLGLFGIESGLSGAIGFLRTGRAILESPETALWVTAQGRFADVRERPARLMRGVGQLFAALPGGTVVPLALEYLYWGGRLPEALARFGPPIPFEPGRTADEWTARLESALQRTQDELAAEAIRRDPEAFDVLVTGRGGISWVYDFLRRFGQRDG